MPRALMWKEWLKARGVFALLAAAHAAAWCALAVELGAAFASEHPEMLWYQALVLGNVFVDVLRHLPWAGGAALAVAQHLPETRGKRLRLTLHLPLSMNAVTACSLAVGVGLVLTLALADAAAAWLLLARHFPAEAVRPQVLALLAWQGAGLAAYLAASFALFEPSLWGRLHALALGGAATAVFLAPLKPGAWSTGAPLALALLAPLALAPFLAVSRQRLTGKNQ